MPLSLCQTESHSTTKGSALQRLRRIKILLVHGVGKRTHYEFHGGFLLNFKRALLRAGRAHDVEIAYGNQIPLQSATPTLCRDGVLVRWRHTARDADGNVAEQITEAQLEEVNWSDLDERSSFFGWLRFVFWGLGMPGIRRYRERKHGSTAERGLRLPGPVSLWRHAGVRFQLYWVSTLFLLGLLSINFILWILRRFNIRFALLEDAHAAIYDYVGDVKLYQDHYLRWDQSVEIIGEHSRDAIRRRVVRALVRTAREMETVQEQWDGYYVFSHSLGSVAVFNAFMEPEAALPNYLHQDEWEALPAVAKDPNAAPPAVQTPTRPTWLHGPGALRRDWLFSRCLGFVSVGCPLNKYVSLWPYIVPINERPLQRAVPWINVSEVQDLVAGPIDLAAGDPPVNISGLELQHHGISTQGVFGFFTAHASYWHTDQKRRPRITDSLLRWLEGERFVAPENTLPPRLAQLYTFISVLVCAAVALAALAYPIAWLVGLLDVALAPAHIAIALLAGALATVASVSLIQRLLLRDPERP